MAKKVRRSTKSSADAQMKPPQPMEGVVSDQRTAFKKLTTKARKERAGSEDAFLESKLAILRTHPGLNASERQLGEAQLTDLFGEPRVSAALSKGAPIPGGVGYGMFYTSPFRAAFSRGTSFYYEIVCPHQPGGNVNTYLYLTATNRASKGVEAFVSYQGQNDTRFKVFDWARSDQWQTNIPFANLGDYLRSSVSHGFGLQTLLVWNQTFEIAQGRWRNEVLLHNRAANRWDLIYRYDYASTVTDQHNGWPGSWGPIVETFQNNYQNTRWLGFLNTMLVGRNAAGPWGNWALLTASQSTIRNDGQGFSPLFLDPNHTFVVKS